MIKMDDMRCEKLRNYCINFGMKKCMLAIVSNLFVFVAAFGQSPPGAVIKEPKGVGENCVYKRKYSGLKQSGNRAADGYFL